MKRFGAMLRLLKGSHSFFSATDWLLSLVQSTGPVLSEHIILAGYTCAVCHRNYLWYLL